MSTAIFLLPTSCLHGISWGELYPFHLSIAQAVSSSCKLIMSHGVVTRGHLTHFNGKLNHLLYAFFWVITCLWRWDSVLKHWHLNSRRRVITQKKAYNIQNTAKAWNQE